MDGLLNKDNLLVVLDVLGGDIKMHRATEEKLINIINRANETIQKASESANSSSEKADKKVASTAKK